MDLGLVAPLCGGLRLPSSLQDWQWTSMSMLGSSISRSKRESNCGQEGDEGYDECKGSLRSVIESQIIPRLLQAHPALTASNAQAFDAAYEPGSAEVESFAGMCVDPSPDKAIAFVRELQRNGVGNDDLFLKLMAPAARCLGVWWEEDKTDFTVVTLGLLRMRNVSMTLLHLAS